MTDKIREKFEAWLASYLKAEGWGKSMEQDCKAAYIEGDTSGYERGIAEGRKQVVEMLGSDDVLHEVKESISKAPIEIKGQPKDSIFYGLTTVTERAAYAKAALTAIKQKVKEV